MKITSLIVLVFALQVSAATYAQKVSVSVKNASIKSVFKKLRQQTGYFFIYNNVSLSNANSITLNVKNTELNDVLSAVFKDQPFTYEVQEKIIIVKEKADQVTVVNSNAIKVVTGIVTAADTDFPLQGVTVRIKGSQTVAITNKEGRFSINVPDNVKTLRFSFLGYATLEAPIGPGNKISVKLEPQVTQLNEVQVAFGTSTKRELTNSVAQITSKDFDKRAITNLNSALVGAFPGVQTNAGSGQPGDGPDIRIRGFSSINNGNGPLYVVDGAPYEGVISNINPDDIESISVLKDASATSLYGSRGANGIVLITTKRGKRNQNNISVKAMQGIISRGLPNYETVNAYQYYPLMWEALRNTLVSATVTTEQANRIASGLDPDPGRGAIYGVKDALGVNPFNVADNNIVLPNGIINPSASLLYPDDLSIKNAIKRTGVRSDYTLSMSGGAAKSDYFVSLNYLNDKGFAIGSDFRRISGRVKLNAQPKTWLNAGLNISANRSISNQANEASGINENPFYADLILGPIYSVYRHDPVTGDYLYDSNGNKIFDNGDSRSVMTGRNIVAETMYNINEINRSAILGNGNVDITFLKNFKFSTNFSVNLGNYRSIAFDNPIIGDAIGAGRTSRTNTTSTYSNFNQLLNYSKTFDNHRVKVLLGHENYYNGYDNFNAARRGQIVQGSIVLDNYTTTTDVGSYDREYKTEGYFSRLDYDYKGKYLVNGSFRHDGSSKFSPDKRWGNFWSVGAAWNIDRESFFKSKWIDYLKLRSSYGKVGADNLSGYFLYQALYTIGYNNGSEPGVQQSTVASNDLQWETNSSADAAIEFAMFKSRVSGTIEVFHRESSNLLFSLPLPLTSGLLNRNVNLGGMRNQGIEVQVAVDAVRKKNFNWNINVNATTFKNKVVTLPAEYRGRINGTKRYEEGRSMYEFWLRDWYGVNPADGRELYFAENTKATTGLVYIGTDTLTTSATNAKYHYTGSAIPKVYGSISNTFTYKSFSLQVQMIYQLGGKTFDSDYQSLMYQGTYGRALHVDALKRWQNPGDETDVPRRITGATMYDSDRWLVNSSYLNLRTATLNYNISKTLSNRLGIQNARVYVSGENLFISTARKGLDPTQTFTGAPSYTYAPARVVSLGLNVTL
ncbi:SusC/RagA family TonB-linked outer membrane protein [Mucilaginibacter sp. PAMB04168]|uniref:SusC/RagA family TonB-linked outer membrane protein n=1 Tax=Mucilaginibacter sp. PAMB04168 TaxID=3138567 RepID=UPI0031F653F8